MDDLVPVECILNRSVQNSEEAIARKEKCFVTLSYAQSINGCIAAKNGEPIQISSKKSMEFTHVLRSMHDGILVGIGTILSDDPSLTVRLVEGKNPIPVILDSELRCPIHCKLLSRSECLKPIILTTSTGLSDECIEYNISEVKTIHVFCAASKLQRMNQLKRLGTDIVICSERQQNGKMLINLQDGLSKLFNKGIKSLMVEGGASVITSFIHEQRQMNSFIDQVILTIAPFWVAGVSSISSSLVSEGIDQLKLCEVETVKLDQDIIFYGRF